MPAMTEKVLPHESPRERLMRLEGELKTFGENATVGSPTLLAINDKYREHISLMNITLSKQELAGAIRQAYADPTNVEKLIELEEKKVMLGAATTENRNAVADMDRADVQVPGYAEKRNRLTEITNNLEGTLMQTGTRYDEVDYSVAMYLFAFRRAGINKPPTQ